MWEDGEAREVNYPVALRVPNASHEPVSPSPVKDEEPWMPEK